jgi:tripartite-type tricarboxylate transporter receptor subunit TctC
MKTLLKTLAGVAGLLAIISAPAFAQGYPNKPIRMIVPFPAGGGTDFVGRLVAKYMGDKLGQTIVVENRGGANGGIGLQEVARATPDGYTIAFTSDSPLTTNQWLYKNMPYNAERDFIPVVTVIRLPGMLAVHPSVPVKSIAELVALAKSKPGQLNYASAGVGNFSHLAMELFSQAAGVKMQHVPYKGTGPASLALLGGEVQVGFNNVQTLWQNVQSGKLVALAVAEPKRMAQHPELPPVADTVPGFEMAPYVGIVAPAGTPKDIVDKLSKAAIDVMKDPAVAKQFYDQDLTVSVLGPAEYAALLKEDAKKWEKVTKAAGIQME